MLGDSVRAATPTWVHMLLTELDPTMLTSPDGKRIEVHLEAVCRLVELALKRRGIDGESADLSTIPRPVSPFTRERS